MCSVYQIPKSAAADGIKEFDFSEEEELPDERDIIRRTDQAPVLLSGNALETMSWGFQRQGLGVVNNSRDDNLDSPMWRDAYAERRCLIPMSGFYEWSGPKGRKQTHYFSDPDNGWLFAAGIWEESPKHGKCFSMLTTSANALMAPIHHRMPVLLNHEDRQVYLAGEPTRFAVPDTYLVVSDAPNPLIKRKTDDRQGELF